MGLSTIAVAGIGDSADHDKDIKKKNAKMRDWITTKANTMS